LLILVRLIRRFDSGGLLVLKPDVLYTSVAYTRVYTVDIYLQQTLIFPLNNLVTVSMISGWMTNNKLIIIGISRQCNKLTHFFPMNILIVIASSHQTLCNIGVAVDSDFNFRKDVSLRCCSCFYHISDLRHIRFTKQHVACFQIS